MTKPLRVLIVEDSENDAELLVRELRRGSYDPAYERVDTPEAMNAALDRETWDLILSDYIMPHFGGLDALALLRRRGVDLPFIIVSGSISEDTAVAAMKAGAHDYIMKNNLKRLAPAVERELLDAGIRRERKLAEEKFRAVAETANDAIISADSRGDIIYFNKGAERIFGYSANKVIGQPLTLLMPERFQDAHRNGLARFLSTGEAHVIGKTVELAGARKDGTEFPLELSLASWKTGEGTFFTGILRDVTERKQAEEMVQHAAFYDTLTDLPNRNKLYDRIQNAIRLDSGEGKPMALLLMDLDHFKEINDTLGHHRGDLVLQQVGSRLKSVLFEPDAVARLGGDEFAILLPRLADAEHISIVTRKILKALEPPFVIEGLPVAVEASIGAALYPDHGANPDSLTQRADIAMYAAKQSGNGYVIYDAKIDQHSPRRLALLGELRQAIDSNQLFLHYQPKIDLKTNRVADVEALVRWQHPEHGFIPPDQFIGPAEQTGLIKPLTLWVFNAAQRQCLTLHQAGMAIPVSVNLSARNLHDPQLPDLLSELLQACGETPDRLMLEITESAIMLNPTRALEIITRLRTMGIRFSIDDFGTGYSSLGYLKRLPVDEIKIDKSFVIGMAVDKNDAVIVRSTIELGHNLGLRVVAEGVESKEIWDKLVAMGCDAAQGYYMCRPLPAAELTRWLSESPWGLAKDPRIG